MAVSQTKVPMKAHQSVSFGADRLTPTATEDLKTTKIQSFDNWFKTFKGSLLGKPALRELGEYFPPDQESERDRLFHLTLCDIVLSSCYGAAMFDRNPDPSKNERRADAEALKQLDRQREIIVELRNFATTHRNLSGIAFGQTLMDLKTKGIGFGTTDGKTRDVVDILTCILDTFSSRLVGPIPFIAAGPSLNRFVYGCLHYDLPLDDGKHDNFPDVETMLLFDLVQTFRLRSKSICGRQTGEPMPAQGKPNYALAAAFVSATFKTKPKMKAETARHRLRDFLKRNQNVGYITWPVFRNP